MGLLLTGSLAPAAGWAWGDTGHAAIGMLAMEQVSPRVHEVLSGFLDSLEPDRIASACNWPDRILKAGLADWSKPLHFVNLPLEAKTYSRERDCADGECLPEATRRYIGVLGDPGQPDEVRREAFAFVCHFVGDLHQPLHVSYAIDRGGFDLPVTWQGETFNLHHFWDVRLIAAHVADAQTLTELLRRRPNPVEPHWSPALVDTWTNETLAFTRQSAYPETTDIDDAFAQHAWNVVLQRLDAAASRLATILDAELGDKGLQDSDVLTPDSLESPPGQ